MNPSLLSSKRTLNVLGHNICVFTNCCGNIGFAMNAFLKSLA